MANPKRTGLGRGIGALIPTIEESRSGSPVDVFFAERGEGESELEGEGEGEFEHELEGEFEGEFEAEGEFEFENGEQFLGGLGKFFKKALPVLKSIAKVAAPMWRHVLALLREALHVSFIDERVFPRDRGPPPVARRRARRRGRGRGRGGAPGRGPPAAP